MEFFAPADGTFPGGVIATASFDVLDVPELGVQLLGSIDPTVIEGEVMVLDIELINRPPTTDDIELDYNIITSGVDAIEPQDRSGSLNFVAPNDIATLELRTLAGDYGPDGQGVNIEFFDSSGSIGSIGFTVVDDTLEIALDTANPTEIIEGLPITLGLSRSGGPTGELTLGYNVISGASAIAAVDHGGGVTFSANDDSTTLTLDTLLGDYPEDGQSVFVEFFAPPDGTFPGGVIATASFSVIENDKDNGSPPEFVRHETPISFDSTLGYYETLTMLPPLTDGGYRIEFSMLVGTHVPVFLPILTRGEVDANDIEIYLQPQRGFANIAVVHNRGNGGPLDFVTYEFKDPLLETGDSNYYCAPVDVVVEYGAIGERSLRVSVNGTELTPQPIATATGWNDQDNLTPPRTTTGNWWLGRFEHTSLDGVHYFNGDLGNLRVTHIDLATGDQTPVGLVLVATDEDPGVGYDGANACPAEVVVNEGNTLTFGPIACANPARGCSANIFASFSNSAGQFDFSELFTISVDKFPDSASNWLDFDFKLFREAKVHIPDKGEHRFRRNVNTDSGSM